MLAKTGVNLAGDFSSPFVKLASLMHASHDSRICRIECDEVKVRSHSDIN